MPSAKFRFPQDVPVLADGEVTLRAHEQRDLERIVQACSDERTQRFIPLPHPYGPQQAQDYLDSRAAQWQADPVGPVWAIEVDGQLAGSLDLTPRSNTTAEIGYWTHPDVRGRGVMTKAARLAIGYAKDVLGLTGLIWRANAGNFASWRVAWANGFRFVATWPDADQNSSGEPNDLWLGHLPLAGWSGEAARPWWQPAVLTGERVVLRPWHDDDAPNTGPDEVARQYIVGAGEIGMQPEPSRYGEWLLERRRRMAEGGAVLWCIADRTTDRPLGHLQITRLHIDFVKGTGSLGYWLFPEARGRGVLQEALDLLIPHAFAERTDDAGLSGLGLHRLEAGTDISNRASQRALRRAGFRVFGEEREVLAHVDRPPTGALSFELLASDDRDAQRVHSRTVPVLTTQRLVLRPWTTADRPRPDQVTDPDARRFMSGELPTADTFEVFLARRARLEDEGTGVSWCLADRETGQVHGSMGLFGIGEGTATNAEVGYWLWSGSRGHGFTGEALDAVVEYAFDTLGLTRLHAETDLDNIASQRTLLRAGFREWGTDHAAYTSADGSITDGAYFELLATDDRTARRPALPPVLHDDAVTLRPLQLDDAQRVWETWADPDSALWLNFREPPTLDQARQYVRRKRYADRAAHGVWWAICAPGSTQLGGAIGLQEIIDGPPSRAELGYWLHPDSRGLGLATAAVSLASAYGLQSVTDGGLGRERLVLNVADGNDASIKVAQQAGFTQVGRDRRAEPIGDGRIVDLLRFDRLQGD